jgi:hypothetical protein
MQVDGKRVRELEEEVESAIAQVMRRLEKEGEFGLPSGRVVHLMAKAAVAVFEAADAIHEQRNER